MADAKIEIKVGGFIFTGEGTEKWLSGELEKLLAKIPELVELAPAVVTDEGESLVPQVRVHRLDANLGPGLTAERAWRH